MIFSNRNFTSHRRKMMQSNNLQTINWKGTLNKNSLIWYAYMIEYKNLINNNAKNIT